MIALIALGFLSGSGGQDYLVLGAADAAAHSEKASFDYAKAREMMQNVIEDALRAFDEGTFSKEALKGIIQSLYPSGSVNFNNYDSITEDQAYTRVLLDSIIGGDTLNHFDDEQIKMALERFKTGIDLTVPLDLMRKGENAKDSDYDQYAIFMHESGLWPFEWLSQKARVEIYDLHGGGLF